MSLTQHSKAVQDLAGTIIIPVNPPDPELRVMVGASNFDYMSPFLQRVFLQGNEGSCVENAIAIGLNQMPYAGGETVNHVTQAGQINVTGKYSTIDRNALY